MIVRTTHVQENGFQMMFGKYFEIYIYIFDYQSFPKLIFDIFSKHMLFSKTIY